MIDLFVIIAQGKKGIAMYRMFRSEWVYLNMSAGRAF
jgi:hypothetical protein